MPPVKLEDPSAARDESESGTSLLATTMAADLTEASTGPAAEAAALAAEVAAMEAKIAALQAAADAKAETEAAPLSTFVATDAANSFDGLSDEETDSFFAALLSESTMSSEGTKPLCGSPSHESAGRKSLLTTNLGAVMASDLTASCQSSPKGIISHMPCGTEGPDAEDSRLSSESLYDAHEGVTSSAVVGTEMACSSPSDLEEPFFSDCDGDVEGPGIYARGGPSNADAMDADTQSVELNDKNHSSFDSDPPISDGSTVLGGGCFAYVVLLFGEHPSYCVEAAVLGQSLRNTGTPHQMILLHTEDVPVDWLSLLVEVGWETRAVGKIDAEGLYDGSQNNRFDGVFTKLHVLALLEFDKVVMLDADLLVRKNVDSLFLREAPSALRRHAAADYPDGQKIPRKSFFKGDGSLASGINAGVMVLRPSLSDYNAIIEDLANGTRHKHEMSRMPEQDYLTRFYADHWYSLGVQFNYQPHQVAFTDRGGLESCTRLTMDYAEEVHIVHFSALPKPRDWLFCSKYQAMSRQWFAMDVLFEHYLEGINKDRRGKHGKLSMNAIEAQLRSATLQATMEWFEVWDQLIEQMPTLKGMVEVAAQTYPLQPKPFSTGRKQQRSRSPRRRRKR